MLLLLKLLTSGTELSYEGVFGLMQKELWLLGDGLLHREDGD
jgi:hypothetical protein